MNPKIQKLAKILVDYSTAVKKNDIVQIIANTEAEDMALEIYRLVLKAGAYPRLHMRPDRRSWIYYTTASMKQLKKFPDIDMHELRKTKAVIYIGAPENTRSLSNIDPGKLALRSRVMKRYDNWRVEKTRWVIFNYPTNALAQEADMSIDEYQNFVFNSCMVDWKKQAKQQEKLKQILDRGSKVRITGKNTDLSFSIRGRKATSSSGHFNMPDGEVFIAPVENSVMGKIRYTFPAIYNNREVKDVKLGFKQGRVVKAIAEKGEDFLKSMIKTDKGSSYLGEFGIGTNYRIKRFTKSILFDEKIGGTVHLALGRAYREGGGKNESALHWDMIKDLRKGGCIYVDGKCIQKNGKFLGGIFEV